MPTGNPSAVSLVLVARMARQVAMQTPGQDGQVFLEMDRLKEGHLTFMAAAHYTINRWVCRTLQRECPKLLRNELKFVFSPTIILSG